MLYSYVGSSPLQVTLDWLNALQLCGFKCPASHTGLVECFTVRWVQVPSKPQWIDWMLYSCVGSSPLQVTLDWLNALQLCGFKSSPSHTGLVECFTATWVQVPFKLCWIGWMLYSYMGSSPLQVMLDWLNALQLHGFKSHWIGWMLYSYMGSSSFQVTLDWLNALQVCGFKCPSSCAGLVECFTAMWVKVLSKSHWIGWMLYSYVGSGPLQVTLDWLNVLQLCGFKCPASHTGLVECFTATWVQVPSKSKWIDWMLYSCVGSSPLQVTLDWLNA